MAHQHHVSVVIFLFQVSSLELSCVSTLSRENNFYDQEEFKYVQHHSVSILERT